MEEMLEEGCRFMLAKKGLEDTGGTTKLEELLSAISNPSVALEVDDSFPLDHHWWTPALTKVVTHLSSGSFDDPNLPGWRDLQYPVVPFPEELLRFSEADASPRLELSTSFAVVALLPSSSATTLAIPPEDVSGMHELGVLPLSFSPTEPESLSCPVAETEIPATAPVLSNCALLPSVEPE